MTDLDVLVVGVLVVGVLCFLIGFLLHEHYANWRAKKHE
jgi:hypothetical protein